MEITVREQALPGVGQRFEIDLDHERRIVVVAARDGRRTIGIAHGDDELDEACSLTADQAMMVGALLLGARFAIDTAHDPGIQADRVVVETITIPDGAPSVGRRAAELVEPLGPDVAVLGVVRDVTPEVVEDDVDTPLAAGDRVAVAARHDLVARVERLLTG
jgi:TrkA domain protein